MCQSTCFCMGQICRREDPPVFTNLSCPSPMSLAVLLCVLISVSCSLGQSSALGARLGESTGSFVRQFRPERTFVTTSVSKCVTSLWRFLYPVQGPIALSLQQHRFHNYLAGGGRYSTRFTEQAVKTSGCGRCWLRHRVVGDGRTTSIVPW